jgi:Predicted NADH:ubiquinone oxidoreductase, subunit RnfB
MNLILIALITLGVIGAIGAVILFIVAQKFYVYEDPRIGQVEAALPQANCGGCGFPGCKGFASACVKADTLDGLNCPVGGAPVMAKVATILGKEVAASEPKVAVVRCNGTCETRPRTSVYNGAKSCAVAANTFAGETGCSFGCIGLGDCELACDFGAIHINPETGIPEVDEDKCTACGACVKACPKFIIQLRKKGKNNRRVFVSCVNKDKGGVARKACTNACIGCGKCQKECPFDAITVENNVAYIDDNKCKSCRKCEAVCPTGAIHAVNFPPRKERPATDSTATAKTAPATQTAPAEVKPKANPTADTKQTEASAPDAPKAE